MLFNGVLAWNWCLPLSCLDCHELCNELIAQLIVHTQASLSSIPVQAWFLSGFRFATAQAYITVGCDINIASTALISVVEKFKLYTAYRVVNRLTQ